MFNTSYSQPSAGNNYIPSLLLPGETPGSSG
jgi:hypothetical protein